jgi:hypothetical protein
VTDNPQRFRLIEGGDKPKRYRARNKGDAEPLVCKCGSSTVIETKTGVMLKDGKPSGGTKIIRCYHCGEVVL